MFISDGIKITKDVNETPLEKTCPVSVVLWFTGLASQVPDNKFYAICKSFSFMSTLQQATFNKCTFYWRRLKWSGCLLPQCFENVQSQSESLSPPLSDGDKKSILMNIYVPPVFLEFVIRHLAFSYKESKPIIALLFDGDVTQSFWVCVAIRDRRLLKFLSRPLPWAPLRAVVLMWEIWVESGFYIFSCHPFH